MSETQVTAPSATPKKASKRRGPRRLSTAAKIRRALDRGEAPMVIAKRLKVTPSAVYKIRHKMRTAETQGTGIASLAPLSPTYPQGTVVYIEQPAPAEASTEVAPTERPSLWQRIKLYVWGKK